MNPLLRPLDAGWALIKSLLIPPTSAASSWFAGIGRALLPIGDVYDVVEPGPGGSYAIVSAHPKMTEALIVMDALIASGRKVSVMLDVDVQRHNRTAAMRVYNARSATGYCGPDGETSTMPEGDVVLPDAPQPLPRREPGATLPDAPS